MDARAARSSARGRSFRKDVDAALAKFHGTWRRFEYKGKMKGGALVYDDYAHHPTEIRATLAALHEQYPKNASLWRFSPISTPAQNYY